MVTAKLSALAGQRRPGTPVDADLEALAPEIARKVRSNSLSSNPPKLPPRSSPKSERKDTTNVPLSPKSRKE